MTWLFLYIFIIKKSEYCHNYFFFHNVLFYSTILRFGKMVFILSPVIVMLSYHHNFELVYTQHKLFYKLVFMEISATSAWCYINATFSQHRCNVQKMLLQKKTFSTTDFSNLTSNSFIIHIFAHLCIKIFKFERFNHTKLSTNIFPIDLYLTMGIALKCRFFQGQKCNKLQD